MLELPEGLEIDLDPLDVRYRRNLRGVLRRFKHLYDAIIGRYGDEGLEMITHASTEYGKEIADRLKERHGVMDLREMGLLIIKVFNNMRAKGRVVEFSDEEVAIEIHHCPYPMDTREQCEAHITMEKVLVDCINPSLVFLIDESVTKGDSVCIYRLRRKKG